MPPRKKVNKKDSKKLPVTKTRRKPSYANKVEDEKWRQNLKRMHPSSTSAWDYNVEDEDDLPVTFAEFQAYTNIRSIHEQNINLCFKNNERQRLIYLNDEEYLRSRTKMLYYTFYTRPDKRCDVSNLRPKEDAPATFHKRFFAIPAKYAKRVQKSPEPEVTEETTADRSALHKWEEDIRNPQPSTSTQAKKLFKMKIKEVEGDEARKVFAKALLEKRRLYRQDVFLEFPVTLDVFAATSHWEAVVDDIISCAREPGDPEIERIKKSKIIREKVLSNYYYSFYEKPDKTRSLFPLALKAAPAIVKARVLSLPSDNNNQPTAEQTVSPTSPKFCETQSHDIEIVEESPANRKRASSNVTNGDTEEPEVEKESSPKRMRIVHFEEDTVEVMSLPSDNTNQATSKLTDSPTCDDELNNNNEIVVASPAAYEEAEETELVLENSNKRKVHFEQNDKAEEAVIDDNEADISDDQDEEEAEVEQNIEPSNSEICDNMYFPSYDCKAKMENTMILSHKAALSTDFLKAYIKGKVKPEEEARVLKSIQMLIPCSDKHSTSIEIQSVEVIVPGRRAEDIYFQKLKNQFTLAYMLGSCKGNRQRVLQAILAMTFEEFVQYTHIHNGDEIYKNPELIRRCYEYTIVERKIWPTNLYIGLKDLIQYLWATCKPFKNFHLSDISPKFLHYTDLTTLTDFPAIVSRENCVRLDEVAVDELERYCEKFYKRCWLSDKWLEQVPHIMVEGILQKMIEFSLYAEENVELKEIQDLWLMDDSVTTKQQQPTQETQQPQQQPKQEKPRKQQKPRQRQSRRQQSLQPQEHEEQQEQQQQEPQPEQEIAQLQQIPPLLPQEQQQTQLEEQEEEQPIEEKEEEQNGVEQQVEQEAEQLVEEEVLNQHISPTMSQDQAKLQEYAVNNGMNDEAVGINQDELTSSQIVWSYDWPVNYAPLSSGNTEVVSSAPCSLPSNVSSSTRIEALAASQNIFTSSGSTNAPESAQEEAVENHESIESISEYIVSTSSSNDAVNISRDPLGTQNLLQMLNSGEPDCSRNESVRRLKKSIAMRDEIQIKQEPVSFLNNLEFCFDDDDNNPPLIRSLSENVIVILNDDDMGDALAMSNSNESNHEDMMISSQDLQLNSQTKSENAQALLSDLQEYLTTSADLPAGNEIIVTVERPTSTSFVHPTTPAPTCQNPANCKNITIRKRKFPVTMRVEKSSIPTQPGPSLSQDLSNDLTIFNNTNLLRVINQPQIISQTLVNHKTDAQKVNDNSPVTIRHTTTHNGHDNNDENEVEVLCYRTLYRFDYFSALTEEQMSDYELPVQAYGQTYMSALIDDGRQKLLLSGDILSALFSYYKPSTLHIMRQLLSSLKEYHFNRNTDKSAPGDVHDSRVRTLTLLMQYAPPVIASQLYIPDGIRENAQLRALRVVKESAHISPPSCDISQALRPKIYERMRDLRNRHYANDC